MTYKEINDILQPVLGTYQGGTYGPSLINQYRNANLALGELKDLWYQGDITDDQLKAVSSPLKGQKTNAAVSAGLTALNGITNIYSTADNLSSIANTSQYYNAISGIGTIGRGDYGSYEQLASEYGRLGSQPNLDYDEIRGLNDWQKAGNVASSTLSGISAGATVGGPWGAAIGGVVGLGAGVYGWLTGDEKAKIEKNHLQKRALLATDAANQNLDAAGERLSQYNFRSGVSHVVADGGKIDRRQMSVKEFADAVLNKKRVNSVTHSSGLIRKHCKGGTMIRIKVK